jgi:16S rRNA (guanine(966)-N(2))-methyltransferase RsmD
VRVLAGTLKGQRLAVPRGSVTRPTADRVRIACLDTLMPHLDGPFLDLFAGAGGVGIEALSRGAPRAVFVEQDARALRALRENIERLELGARAAIVRGDAAGGIDRLARGDTRFAAVFVDPPYGSPRLEPALAALGRGELLLPGAVVVVQHGSKAPPAERIGVLSVWKTRKFGETTLTFFRAPA